MEVAITLADIHGPVVRVQGPKPGQSFGWVTVLDAEQGYGPVFIKVPAERLGEFSVKVDELEGLERSHVRVFVNEFEVRGFVRTERYLA